MCECNRILIHIMPHHTMFNHIMTHNANPNANSKMNMTTVRCPITNETTLAIYPVVHLTSTHPWDPTMLDAPNPYHSLARSMDHQLELQKVHKQKYYADGFFRSRCDHIPLQSSLCLNLTPMINHMINFSHCHWRMGSRSLRKVKEF